MQKKNYLPAALLLFGAVVCPVAVAGQANATFVRTALARMNVGSRAALFEKTIANAAAKEGVDPLILWTIAYNETRFRPWLTSPKNARGLMQFIPATAARFGLADPYEPTASIYAAARYVKYLDGLFGRRIESVLAAYNSGEGTVLAYLHGRSFVSNGKLKNANRQRTIYGVPPYRETLDYVENGKRIYRWLEGQGRFPVVRMRSSAEAASPKSTANRQPNSEDTALGTSAITVFYDPRTGNRHLVGRNGKVLTMSENGPVVIVSEVRGLSTQKARSTFAGLLP